MHMRKVMRNYTALAHIYTMLYTAGLVDFNLHTLWYMTCGHIVLTFNSETRCVIGWLIISHSTCVESSQSLSHSQSVSVLCSHWVIQDSLISFSDSDRVSGPSDSVSRSTKRDTSEDELISINTSEFYCI